MHFGRMADHFSQRMERKKLVRIAISKMKPNISSKAKNSRRKMTVINIVWLFVCHSHKDSDHGIFITPASCYLCRSHHHMTSHSNVSITHAILKTNATDAILQPEIFINSYRNDGNSLYTFFIMIIINPFVIHRTHVFVEVILVDLY